MRLNRDCHGANHFDVPNGAENEYDILRAISGSKNILTRCVCVRAQERYPDEDSTVERRAAHFNEPKRCYTRRGGKEARQNGIKEWWEKGLIR